MVKAQVKVGGRGKAGGVKAAHGPDEAATQAEAILGMDIKGHTVHRVMIAQGAKIAEEYYVSLLLDRSNRRYLAMASREGGMEIEQARRRAAGGAGPRRGRPDRRRRRREGRRGRRGRPVPRRGAGPGRRRPAAGCGRSTATRTPRWSR
ncbi:hypothetical protein GCM10025868_34450 [Angustibacter aerolatus]|uniref:ATP-grasp fold succinyl-CoA synthetase-type domain-containing protein n=1 Tax=Angustibacter aerolatus TaxID=1162965 RepID=A0ABQ6JN61_9ACTN|nr:hypothetical protein GCM10025868_34450 [Angustibacter aerolatus]